MPQTSTSSPGQHAWPRAVPWWAAAGWAALWTVGLLAPAIGGVQSTQTPGWAEAGLALAGVCFGCIVLSALRSSRRGGWWRGTLLGVQVATTGLLGTVDGLAWTTLPLMSAISVAVSVDLAVAVAAVPAVAVVGAMVQHARGDTWSDAVWGTGLSTALAGFLTLAISWLGTLVGELDRTRTRLADLAVAQERVRFSRDLHDLLGHTLSVVVVKAQAARRAAPVDAEAAVRHATDIEQIGREALTEVRDAVRGYRSGTWSDRMAEAVATLTEAGIETHVVGTRTGLTSGQEEIFGWVVREGVTNVLRHSNASQVSIAVSVEPGLARLTVRDDGDGGPLPTRDGAGLTGLRERVGASGGVLTGGSDGRGFTVVAVVPDVA